MKILKSDNGVITECNYPRNDYELVAGLDEGIQFYHIEEIKPVNDDPDRYYLKPKETVLTDIAHPDYSHLLKAVKEWELVEYAQSVTIQKLNNSLGEHMDGNYPNWKRTKHMRELGADITQERRDYINSLFSWEDNCRASRDEKEVDFVEDNTFPNLHDWEPIPEKI